MSKRPRRACYTEIRALARFRRAQHVTLDALAQEYGCSTSWLSLVMRGLRPISRDESRTLRALIARLGKEVVSREGLEPSTPGLKVRCSTN